MITTEYISTPGEILKEEFLEPRGISQYRLAKVIGKPESAISAIVNGHCSISVEMGWLLAQAPGTPPAVSPNRESTYRLKTFDASAMPKVEALS